MEMVVTMSLPMINKLTVCHDQRTERRFLETKKRRFSVPNVSGLKH